MNNINVALPARESIVRLLGIDPGLIKTGWGIVSIVVENAETAKRMKMLEYVASGLIKTSVVSKNKDAKISKPNTTLDIAGMSKICSSICSNMEINSNAADVISNKDIGISAIRLTEIFKGLMDVISKYKPDYCAIEEVYVNTNFRSSLKLAQARAAAIVACGISGIIPAEYPASSIKKAITGFGLADKNQVKTMLRFFINNEIATKTDDETDAIAIAICHANHIFV